MVDKRQPFCLVWRILHLPTLHQNVRNIGGTPGKKIKYEKLIQVIAVKYDKMNIMLGLQLDTNFIYDSKNLLCELFGILTQVLQKSQKSIFIILS